MTQTPTPTHTRAHRSALLYATDQAPSVGQVRPRNKHKKIEKKQTSSPKKNHPPTHQGVRVLEKEEPLEALLLELLGHPFPEEEVVHVAVAVGLSLQRERVVRGQHQARRAVSEGGDLSTKRGVTCRIRKKYEIREKTLRRKEVTWLLYVLRREYSRRPGETVFGVLRRPPPSPPQHVSLGLGQT